MLAVEPLTTDTYHVHIDKVYKINQKSVAVVITCSSGMMHIIA